MLFFARRGCERGKSGAARAPKEGLIEPERKNGLRVMCGNFVEEMKRDPVNWLFT